MTDVRLARTDEVDELGELLGRAFQDDPLWMWLAPDVARRERHMGAFFAHVIAAKVRQGWGWTTTGGDGAAVWAAPGHWKMTPLEIVKLIPDTLRTMGMRDLYGRLQALTRMEAAHPTEPHWYLEIIGSEPTMRGKGIGSALIQPMIDRCDAEGMPAYLESSKLENVPFYRRFGFVESEELVVAPGCPPIWPMWRDPR